MYTVLNNAAGRFDAQRLPTGVYRFDDLSRLSNPDQVIDTQDSFGTN